MKLRWLAITNHYNKFRHPSNHNDKYYTAIVREDNVTYRNSKRKHKTVTNLLEYVKRLNYRLYRWNYSAYTAQQPYKFTWTIKNIVRWLWLRGKPFVQKTISIVLSVFFVDISFYQGVINWPVMKASTKNVRGAFIRAGQSGYADPQFPNNWKNAKAAGMPRGTYWFFDSRTSPQTQAAMWWNLIKNDKGELPHAADLEESYGGAYAGSKNWRIFLEEFMRLSGLPASKIIIYTGYYYWIEHAPLTFSELNWFAQFKLWLAWYTSNPANVLIPKPWTQDKLFGWQNGTPPWGFELGCQSVEIDSDWFNGTLTEWKAYYEVVPPDTTNPPVSGMTHTAGQRNGYEFDLFKLEPSRFRFELVYLSPSQLENVSSVTKRKGAVLGVAGGEWNNKDATLSSYLKPKEYTVSNGRVIIPRTVAAPPSLMITSENAIVIDHKDTDNVQQAFSGVIYLVQNGVVNANLYDLTKVDNVEGHARNVFGLDAMGHLLIFESEGVYPNQGWTHAQVAEYMVGHGAITAFFASGGGDVACCLLGQSVILPENIDPITGSHFERKLPGVFLVYAKGETMNGTAKEKLGKYVTIRSAPHVATGNGVGQIIPYTTVSFVKIVGDTDHPDDLKYQWLDLTGDPDNPQFANYWYPNSLGISTERFAILTSPTVDPIPDSFTMDVSAYDVKVVGDKYEAKGVKLNKSQ